MKAVLLLFGAALAVAACSGGDGAPGGGHSGVAGAASSGGAGGSGPGGGGGGGSPKGPHLVVPGVIDLPYVIAGTSGSAVTVDVQNDGDASISGLAWALTGDPSITLGAAPTSLAAGEKAPITITYAGAPTEAIAIASLSVDPSGQSVVVPVFAAAGDPKLGAAAWEDVIDAGRNAGRGVTVAMPAAPYPDGTSAFTDASVRVFLPEGYRDRGAQDVIVHFHGFDTTLADTLASHLYQQHLYASGSNAVLIVPQGPVSAASGDFGKLMKPGGLARLVDEVLVLLYREGKIQHPALGEVVLTSHSGGYEAVAVNLDPATMARPIAQIDLFDSIYGYVPTFEAYALGGGVFRSSYTLDGGTLDDNQSVAAWLTQKGDPPASEATQIALRGAAPVIYFAATSHDGSTRIDGAYGEEIRWRLPRSRRGPRIELRSAVAKGGTATVAWLAPPDDDVTGFVIETSPDGATWSAAATVGPSAAQASFPLVKGARVRVKSVVTGVAPADVLPSDTYRIDPQPTILVVDGFDRVLDGSFGGLHHDFSAIVGEAAGPVASVSHRAVVEDGFDLSPWPVVIWLVGDESIADHALSDAEQQALIAYVDGGGSLVMSGSEIAYELGQSAAGKTFLAHCFGATFVTDDSGSLAVTGTGALSTVAGFTYAGPNAPYPEDFPDVLGATMGGQVLLQYGSGQPAAVGLPGKGVLVGFPLELIDTASDEAAVVKALVGFTGG